MPVFLEGRFHLQSQIQLADRPFSSFNNRSYQFHHFFLVDREKLLLDRSDIILITRDVLISSMVTFWVLGDLITGPDVWVNCSHELLLLLANKDFSNFFQCFLPGGGKSGLGRISTRRRYQNDQRKKFKKKRAKVVSQVTRDLNVPKSFCRSQKSMFYVL